MNYVTCGAFQIPCVFLTALSYAKSANTALNSQNRAKFCNLSTAEISVRFEVSRPRCMAAGESFAEWCDRVEGWSSDLSVKPEPAIFLLSGFPLYSSLLFAMTSINLSYQQDSAEIVSIEADVTFAGVSAAKDAVRTRVLVRDEMKVQLPAVTVSANGKTVKISEICSLSALTMTERGCSLTLAFGDAQNILSRDALTSLISDHNATVTIDGYGDFYVISADQVDEEISINASVLPVEFNRVFSRTYTNSDLAISGFSNATGLKIGYMAWHGSEAERLKRLQESMGFLVDYPTKTLRPVPDSLKPTTDVLVHVDSDLVSEGITKVVWQDGYSTYTAGDDSGAVFGVNSVCRVDSNKVANSCLSYVRYMQNYIILDMPYDGRIRQHSVINVVKNATSVPCMVEKYDIDFFTNWMTLECHWV